MNLNPNQNQSREGYSVKAEKLTGLPQYPGFSRVFNTREEAEEALEQLEKDIGEPIELDPVAFCCDYSEYSNAGEAASEYFEFEGMTYNEDGDELETAEEVEEKALDFLRDRTSVIEFEAGIIVQDF